VEVAVPYPTLLDWLERGLCVVQDESSMLVSHVVDPREGQVVVDACAAPGGKSTHLALLGGERCRVIAVDRNPGRLKAMRNAVRRLGLKNIDIRMGDAARLREVVEVSADAVLLDAPCSGLGTLRRNPELKWKRFPGDIANLAGVQSRLIRGCAEAVRPGGVLVYSVCTFTLEETVGVVEDFLRERKDFVPESPASLIPETLAVDLSPRGYLQILPHRHGMEGMFIARLRRKE
jgi:16S rRNA (cytosine967-C5)-methyltransferase